MLIKFLEKKENMRLIRKKQQEKLFFGYRGNSVAVFILWGKFGANKKPLT